VYKYNINKIEAANDVSHKTS